MTPRVSPERLLGDLEALAAIGGRPDGGVDRVAGSEADAQARRWLMGRLAEAGAEVRQDAAGNVFGRLAGSQGPWLLAGSHTDTVPAGGRLDGAYGVIAALEVLRCLVESGHEAAGRLEVVSFADEEGVGPGGGLAGSTHLCGTDHVGSLCGYLELHIEQGPRLEAAAVELGVVEGIVGIDRWDVSIRGAANHAGTTPMAARHDAGAAAGEVLAGLRDLLAAVDPDMVGNVGRLDLLPGATNVVPGEARFTVELRSLRPDSQLAAAAALGAAVEAAATRRGCAGRLDPRSSIPPSPMDPFMVGAVERACAESGRPSMRLVSGAGHDAGVLAHRVPSAMLFVPSRAGISHSPAEYTRPDQLVLGCQVLMSAAIGVLGVTKV